MLSCALVKLRPWMVVFAGVGILTSGCSESDGIAELGNAPKDSIPVRTIPNPGSPPTRFAHFHGTIEPLVWNFDDARELEHRVSEWRLSNHIGNPVVENGLLAFDVIGNDPQLVLTHEIDLLKYQALEVRMEVSSNESGGAMFWEESRGSGFSPERRQAFDISEGAFHTYTFPLEISDMPSKVSAIRLDPTDKPGRVRIDWIRFLPLGSDKRAAFSNVERIRINRELRAGRLFVSPFEYTQTIQLPSNPFLEISFGSLTPGSNAMLSVEISEKRTGAKKELSTTTSEIPRWKGMKAYLSEFSGREVELTVRATLDDEEGLGVLGPTRIFQGGGKQSRNVLLVVIDTLRADHLSAYGYGAKTSPNLDRFCDEATRFEYVVSQSPWTLPAVASILTSRYPRQLGIRFAENHSLSTEARSLAEVLRDAGSDTACIFGNFIMTDELGYEQGFESFEYAGESEFRADVVTDRGISWLESHKDRQFFLYLHYMDPHETYMPPVETCGTNPFFNEEDIADPPPAPHLLFLRTIDLDRPDRLEQLRRLYDSEIFYLDTHLGRLFSYLRDAGLLENTLIVVTSDHGEEFLEHGGWIHGATVYDELVRVPLILRFPDSRTHGRVVANPVGLIDIFPTVVEWVGIGEPMEMEGVSLHSASVSGEAPGTRPLYSETHSHGPVRTALVRDNWKLIHFPTGEPYRNPEDVVYKFLVDKAVPYQLFDRSADPGETNNLRNERESISASLLDEMRRWKKDNAGPAPSGSNKAEMNERLRALGYVDTTEEHRDDSK